MNENENSTLNIKKRIEKDITMFYTNLSKLEEIKDEKSLKVIELAKMYASDAKSYIDKNDYYTSFSCISYAHGLLDAILISK
ncbi:MAG: DUF357 domain-containing protein [Candidatus Marsarchaeota archaeon]|jgi:hypothetical protein|nr:DUF357 domain-containing protein [Candidatus Marsarchaeota archaeon]